LPIVRRSNHGFDARATYARGDLRPLASTSTNPFLRRTYTVCLNVVLAIAAARLAEPARLRLCRRSVTERDRRALEAPLRRRYPGWNRLNGDVAYLPVKPFSGHLLRDHRLPRPGLRHQADR